MTLVSWISLSRDISRGLAFWCSTLLPRPSLPGLSRFEIAGAAPPGAKGEGVISMTVIDLELALKPARTGIGCRMGLSVAPSNPGVVGLAAFANRHEAPSPCLAAAKVFPPRLKRFATPRAMPDFLGQFLVEEKHFP